MSDLEWNNVRDVSCLADAAGRGIKWRARDFGPGSPIHPVPAVGSTVGQRDVVQRYQILQMQFMVAVVAAL